MKRFLLAGFLVAATTSSVFAQSNLRFLQDTPFSKFKKADTDLMFKTLNQTLDSGADDVAVKWENPGTSNSGTITPSKDSKGRADCRAVVVENQHQTLHSKNDAVFCKKDGKWKMEKSQ
jgi:surface antigen